MSALPLLFLIFIPMGMNLGSDTNLGLLLGALIGFFVAYVLICVATFTAFIVAWLWFYRLPIFFCSLILLLGVFGPARMKDGCSGLINSQMTYDRLDEPSATCTRQWWRRCFPQEEPVLPTHAQPRQGPPSPPSIALNDMLCPISGEPMEDPVIAADGFSYERWWIEQWIQSRQSSSQPVTSPKTNTELSHIHLTPNLTLRGAIRDYLDRQRTSQSGSGRTTQEARAREEARAEREREEQAREREEQARAEREREEAQAREEREREEQARARERAREEAREARAREAREQATARERASERAAARGDARRQRQAREAAQEAARRQAAQGADCDAWAAAFASRPNLVNTPLPVNGRGDVWTRDQVDALWWQLCARKGRGKSAEEIEELRLQQKDILLAVRRNSELKRALGFLADAGIGESNAAEAANRDYLMHVLQALRLTHGSDAHAPIFRAMAIKLLGAGRVSRNALQEVPPPRV